MDLSDDDPVESFDDALPSFKTWAVLEILGHKKFAGLISEVEIFGKAWVRLDIYVGAAGTPRVTRYYNPESVYAIHPTTETLCRRYAAANPAEGPISRYDLAEEQQSTLFPEKAITVDPQSWDSDIDGEEYA